MEKTYVVCRKASGELIRLEKVTQIKVNDGLICFWSVGIIGLFPVTDIYWVLEESAYSAAANVKDA